jgi:hypothetical protein
MKLQASLSSHYSRLYVLSSQIYCNSREMLNRDLVASLILKNLYNCYRMPKRVSQIGLNTITMPNQVHLSYHLGKFRSLKKLPMITVTISIKQSSNAGRWPCSSKPRWDLLLYVQSWSELQLVLNSYFCIIWYNTNLISYKEESL